MQFFIDTLNEVGEVYVFLTIMVIAYVIGRIKGEKFTDDSMCKVCHKHAAHIDGECVDCCH
jgi:hypothetical protein